MKAFLRVAFLIILLTPRAVCAFVEEEFFSTISFSINSIGKEGIDYKTYDIVGADSYEAVRQKSMDFLTNDGYKRRTYNHYQYVALPPYSKIDIGYFWFNNTPEIVDVESIRIPLSREVQSNGDLTKLLYDAGFQEGQTCTDWKCKTGKYLDVDGVGLLSSDMYKRAKNGVVVQTLTIMPPVEIWKYEIEYSDIHMSTIYVYVRNNTDDYLENVKINYRGDVSKVVNLQGHEEVVLEVNKHCTEHSGEVNCGQMRIIDHDNRKTYCAMYGSAWGSYEDPDSISVFSRVNGKWLSGSQIQPTLESFCIERIPYVYTTLPMTATLEPQEPEVSTDEYWEELLDLDILPITSYSFNKIDKYISLLKPSIVDNL